MLAFKISENRGPEGVWASLGRSCEAPGGSVALPEKSGKVAGDVEGVPERFWEVQERPVGGGASTGPSFQVP